MESLLLSSTAKPFTPPSLPLSRSFGSYPKTMIRFRKPDPRPANLKAAASAHGSSVSGSGGAPDHLARGKEEKIGDVEYLEEGLAEELENLEEEVMGGEDQGRDPSDYDRRARIFWESSRVFRALKERGKAPVNAEKDGDIM